MTGRERVIATLNHQQPDRIPLDIGGTESSGLTAMAYNKLREHLQLPAGQTQVFDVYQQVVKIDSDLREMFEIDTVGLLIEPRRWQGWTLSDGSACQVPAKWNPQRQDGDWVARDHTGRIFARMPAGGFYFEPVNPPLAKVTAPAALQQHADTIAGFDWPFFADETVADIATRAQQLYEQTDLAIVFNLQVHLLGAGQILRGFENFMVDLLANKPLAHALLERLTESYIDRAGQCLAAFGKYVQVVLVNDDLGTQNGPMMSAECYKEMIWPYQKRLFGFIKSKADAKLLFHSCGSVASYIPLLIEAGVDALNPVQVSAAGMDTAELKKQFGRNITFWGGGCDTQRVLPKGSAAEIEAEVARRIEELSAGGGFVFTQVHNIQPDVSPENVAAMLEAFRKRRDYA